jgi:hypothetical protein
VVEGIGTKANPTNLAKGLANCNKIQKFLAKKQEKVEILSP